MHTRREERVGLLIDGANLYAASKALGFDVDYKRLLHMAREQGRLVRAIYFALLDEADEHSAVRPLLDWLEYNGFTVVKKRTGATGGGSGRRGQRCGVEVELAVSAMQHAVTLDRVMLFCGDAAYSYLVAALQSMGKHVSVVSTVEGSPSLIADELRRQADAFLDLADLKPMVCRELVRPAAVLARAVRVSRRLAP